MPAMRIWFFLRHTQLYCRPEGGQLELNDRGRDVLGDTDVGRVGTPDSFRKDIFLVILRHFFMQEKRG